MRECIISLAEHFRMRYHMGWYKSYSAVEMSLLSAPDGRRRIARYPVEKEGRQPLLEED